MVDAGAFLFPREDVGEVLERVEWVEWEVAGLPITHTTAL